MTNLSFGTCIKCHCKRSVTVTGVTVSGEDCNELNPLQTADEKDSNGENNDSDEEEEENDIEDAAAAWPPLMRPPQPTSSEVTYQQSEEDSRGSRDDGLSGDAA